MSDITIKEVDSIVAVGILESSYNIDVLKYDEERLNHLIQLLTTVAPSISKLKAKAYENNIVKKV